MHSVVKILATLLLAIATLVAGATCACARPVTAKAAHACCRQGDRPHAPAEECGHCRVSSNATVDGDAVTVVAPPAVALADFAPVRAVEAGATIRRPASPPIALPPPDVLARRNVLQV